jgi:predicted phosphodiesterase
MRLALISDVHANLEALRATLGDIRGMGAERIVCLGDIVGYNADPAACIALLREAGVACVAGNHDRAVAGLRSTEGFTEVAARAVAWTRTRLDGDALSFLASLPDALRLGDGVLAVHGAPREDGGCDMTRLDTPEQRGAAVAIMARRPDAPRLCAFGHTHRVGIHLWRDGAEVTHAADHAALEASALHLLNPGSVGQPRDGARHASWMLLDTARREVVVRRVPFDMAAALAKTRAAGLLPPLTARRRLRAAIGRGLRRVGLYQAVRARLDRRG